MARFSHRIHGLTLFQLGFLMRIIATGGGSLVTSSNEINATGETNEIHLPRGSTCPKAEDILPCVCSYNVESMSMDMDCSDVTSEDQLRTIFNQEFLYTNFSRLTIQYNKNITTLEEGDLGNVSFNEIYLDFCVLTKIEDLTFKASWDTLTSLWLQGNELTSVPDIWNLTQLSDLILRDNKLTQFPSLRSLTLKTLYLDGNSISQIPLDAITTLPLLEDFSCTNCALTEIDSGALAGNHEHLRILQLDHNQLTTIPKDAIRLHGEHTWLRLSSNKLTSLPYEVASGVTGILNVPYNQLRELPEEVYRPLLEKDVEVFLYENLFDCGCDIAWLIENQTLLMKLPFVEDNNYVAPSCSDGVRFIDLDPMVYHQMCDNATNGI